MSGVNDIRSLFIDYFVREGHEHVASSPLVPRNDPTLMFTNAGMVQFKNVFTGLEKRDYQRAVTSQKCVRAGGKHNDLDNVGYTARHHTFFEMLGNFSFGNYFKDRAIELAWRLVTQEFDIPPHRLLVTVFSEDDEAATLWKKIAGLPEDRIVRIPTSDNFWQMGDTGPCGPCSEIFYDHGEGIPGGPPGSPDEDGDRFIEIWNLVFMQFEQMADGERVPLPRPSIDTGMGLERIAAVLQGVHDNYDIDLFRALIAASEELTRVPARGENAPSHKVIADHLRSTAFLVADGVLPSNEGRGYVLRRIMRRAMRHAHLLGAREPVIHRMVPVLVREMGRAFPELARAEDLVTETLRSEEARFQRTLARGLQLLAEETEGLSAGDRLAGEVAFRLYDTYGFPLDLTEDALRARSIAVDHAGFDAAMERQREEARRSWAGSGETADERIWYAIREEAGATEFLGYEASEAEGVVEALVKDGTMVDGVEAGERCAVVLNQTPFYAEAGGQVGDTGTIGASGVRFEVEDTRKLADGLHVHFGRVAAGRLTVGLAVELAIDAERRAAIRANHSATHLLHAALREVLGSHVAQKGSLVAPDRLRFDFSHPSPVTEEELDRIEAIVNRAIVDNSGVTTRLMPYDEAIEEGAMALFGEKYGDEVRVVAMGPEAATLERPAAAARGKRYSVELCGGTHVRRTGDIGLLAVVSEGAVSAGVRRIEALTGETARRHLAGRARALRDVAGVLRVSPAEAAERARALVEERRRLERDLGEARKRLALAGDGAANGANAPPVDAVGGVPLLARTVEGIGGKALKGLADDARKQLGSGVVVIVGRDEDGKASIVVSVSEDLTGRLSAVDLVRAGSAALGGKGGGGRPDMAQAGGPDGARAEAAIAAVRDAIGAAA